MKLAFVFWYELHSKRVYNDDSTRVGRVSSSSIQPMRPSRFTFYFSFAFFFSIFIFLPSLGTLLYESIIENYVDYFVSRCIMIFFHFFPTYPVNPGGVYINNKRRIKNNAAKCWRKKETPRRRQCNFCS